MTREGGQIWYQSIRLAFLHHRYYLVFEIKVPWLFKLQKTVSASSAQKCVASIFVRLHADAARIAQNSDRYTWLELSHMFLNTYNAVCTTQTIV